MNGHDRLIKLFQESVEVPKGVDIVSHEIIRLFVEQGRIEELQHLMNEEIQYAREKFELWKERDQKLQNTMYALQNMRFRERQYTIWTCVAIGMLAALPFINTYAGAIFGAIAAVIAGGCLLNARHRDEDGKLMLKLFMRKETP